MPDEAKKQKILGGPLSAMAQLALHYQAVDVVTKKQFIEICKAAGAGCKESDDWIGAKCLDAICSRLK